MKVAIVAFLAVACLVAMATANYGYGYPSTGVGSGIGSGGCKYSYSYLFCCTFVVSPHLQVSFLDPRIACLFVGNNILAECEYFFFKP